MARRYLHNLTANHCTSDFRINIISRINSSAANQLSTLMTQHPVYNRFIMHCSDASHHSSAMVGLTILLALPAWAMCSGEGNIRLLQDEVAEALKACDSYDIKEPANKQRRATDSYNTYPRIDDDGLKQLNTYGHERRITNDTQDQIQTLNATDNDNQAYSDGNKGQNLSTALSQPAISNLTDNFNRTKRSEPLFNNPDTDQCLSQCVFANLQVVDSRGIPREAELWNKVQTSVTTQQSRAALRDQIRACFQELQTEAEDNGCSYSNKLERCLMLRFSDRQPGANKNSQNQEKENISRLK